MRTLKTKKFYKELAEKYKIGEKIIEDIDKVQFELLVQIMRNSDKRNDKFFVYRIPYFGMFYVSNKVRRNLIKKYGSTTTEQ